MRIEDYPITNEQIMEQFALLKRFKELDSEEYRLGAANLLEMFDTETETKH